jgi:hypothetical protein
MSDNRYYVKLAEAEAEPGLRSPSVTPSDEGFSVYTLTTLTR